ncbi:unnamed protein product [Paramecium sonneborni]|uniref:Uncharacterized protein n=1 Tax=Paramecium sonneborni TaxID=65129 RepID=A0A8S1RV19_9CILI|nr:unnamed protein product [Paramecium sonneborni]
MKNIRVKLLFWKKIQSKNKLSHLSINQQNVNWSIWDDQSLCCQYKLRNQPLLFQIYNRVDFHRILQELSGKDLRIIFQLMHWINIKKDYIKKVVCYSSFNFWRFLVFCQCRRQQSCSKFLKKRVKNLSIDNEPEEREFKKEEEKYIKLKELMTKEFKQLNHLE